VRAEKRPYGIGPRRGDAEAGRRLTGCVSACPGRGNYELRPPDLVRLPESRGRDEVGTLLELLRQHRGLRRLRGPGQPGLRLSGGRDGSRKRDLWGFGGTWWDLSKESGEIRNFKRGRRSCC
jgi:hypothetical protein